MKAPLKALFSFSAFLFAVLVVLFAISNREAVTLALWPLPFEAQFGLYVPVLAALLFGFAFGLIASWVLGGAKRKQTRAYKAKIKALEGQSQTPPSQQAA